MKMKVKWYNGSKIQIFENYEEFCNRKDKTINGVSQQFLDGNNRTLETLNLRYCMGCYNCYECFNCDDCIYCVKCKNCKNCGRCCDCENCYNCELCCDCRHLKYCIDVSIMNFLKFYNMLCPPKE